MREKKIHLFIVKNNGISVKKNPIRFNIYFYKANGTL